MSKSISFVESVWFDLLILSSIFYGFLVWFRRRRGFFQGLQTLIKQPHRIVSAVPYAFLSVTKTAIHLPRALFRAVRNKTNRKRQQHRAKARDLMDLMNGVATTLAKCEFPLDPDAVWTYLAHTDIPPSPADSGISPIDWDQTVRHDLLAQNRSIPAAPTKICGNGENRDLRWFVLPVFLDSRERSRLSAAEEGEMMVQILTNSSTDDAFNFGTRRLCVQRNFLSSKFRLLLQPIADDFDRSTRQIRHKCHNCQHCCTWFVKPLPDQPGVYRFRNGRIQNITFYWTIFDDCP